MAPALSIIFFTVCSGGGYGLFMIFVVSVLLAGTDKQTALVMGSLALVLITLGLASSVGHLATPGNAWRAFNRFRTSWLSREGVLAVVFYPPALLYMRALYTDASTGFWWIALSAAVLILALAVVFSTGMIYACLKTIPNWHTPLGPANYIAMAFSTGGLLFIMVLAAAGHPPSFGQLGAAALLLIVALILKLIYYFWIGKPQGPTLQTATGFHRANVRLLDVGHSAGTFLTDEFGYQISAERVRVLRISVIGLAFAIPVLFIALMLANPLTILAVFAAASGSLGTFLERWLFFAEARHAVVVYHGARQI